MRDCPECGGSGELEESEEWAPIIGVRDCWRCFGTGQVPDDPPPDADDLRDPDEEPEPIEE
jgi:DnaJ-class molecular chaperone